MIIDLFLLTILNSMICTGVYIASQWNGSDQFDEWQTKDKPKANNRMILWWLRYYGKRLPPFFHTPLYQCLPCMASIWSIPVWTTFVIYHGWNLIPSILLWPLFVGAVSGWNIIMSYKIVHHD